MRGAMAESRVFAEFATADDLVDAVHKLKAAGVGVLEAWTPYPVPGLEEELRPPRRRLQPIALAGGLIGGIASYAIQWYANAVSYPLNSGGRPSHAIPAFIPATFEGTVLGAGVFALLGFCFLLRLPALWHPTFEIDGFDHASRDRFWLAAAWSENTTRLLKDAGALRVGPFGQTT